MHSFTLLLLLSTVTLAAGQDCCPYPLSSVITKNVTELGFKCSEPIGFSCVLPDFKEFVGLGVLGNSPAGPLETPSDNDLVLLTFAQLTLDAVATCDTDKKKWNLEGTMGDFEQLKCAKMYLNGKWIVAE